MILKFSVDASHGNLSTYSFAGYMIECVECQVWAKMNAMDSITQSTCDAYCIIQSFWQMLSRSHVPLQQSSYDSLSLLDQGYMSDQALRCL